MEKVTIRERLKAHVSRIQEWKLVELRPLPYEFKRLTEDGVTSPTLQSYSVWRRSMLLTALPSLIYSAIDSFVGVTNEINFEDLNAFGKFVYILPLLSGSVLTVGAAGAWWYWTNNSRSKSWAQACWITSLILPVIPNVFPIQWLVTSSYGAFLRENEAIFFLLRTQLSIASAATLMPILISFPLGMLRSALRIRGLLPDYSLAGWILIVVSPLYILIVTLCLILASQFVGTGLLLVGIAFLVAGPLIYLWKRKLFTESIITEMEAQVIKVQMVVRWTGLLGLFLVILWSFTATVEVQGIEVRLIGWSVENGGEVAPILTYAQWVRLVCLLVGFVLMSSLCFADIFIRFSLADWRTEIKRRDVYVVEQRVAGSQVPDRVSGVV